MIKIGEIKAYDIHEVSTMLHVSEKTARDWCRAQKVPAKKIARRWYVLETDLQQFLEEK